MFRAYIDFRFLRSTFSNVQQHAAELFHVFGLHTIEEDGWWLIVSLHLTFVVIHRNRFCVDIESPYMYMPRAEDMCQTSVATANSLRHFLFAEAIEGIVAYSTYQNQDHSAHDKPYPYRDSTVFTLWIEPLILNGLQLVFSF